jgi:hypothetical protein
VARVEPAGPVVGGADDEKAFGEGGIGGEWIAPPRLPQPALAEPPTNPIRSSLAVVVGQDVLRLPQQEVVSLRAVGAAGVAQKKVASGLISREGRGEGEQK